MLQVEGHTGAGLVAVLVAALDLAVVFDPPSAFAGTYDVQVCGSAENEVNRSWFEINGSSNLRTRDSCASGGTINVGSTGSGTSGGNVFDAWRFASAGRHHTRLARLRDQRALGWKQQQRSQRPEDEPRGDPAVDLEQLEQRRQVERLAR